MKKEDAEELKRLARVYIESDRELMRVCRVSNAAKEELMQKMRDQGAEWVEVGGEVVRFGQSYSWIEVVKAGVPR